MAIVGIPTGTGLAPLPDVGELSYNGVIFSALFYSKIDAKQIKSADGRTIKFTEYTLTATGIVTLSGPATTSTDDVMDTLKQLLAEQGGKLTYTGRGFGQLVVNVPGTGGVRDVAWGPVPEVLAFQPLGGGRGAQVVWTVAVRLSEYKVYQSAGFASVLQFTNQIAITYDEEQYSQLQISGTLEIPITRNTVLDNTVPRTVDDFRSQFMALIIGSIDQTRFRIARRNFSISADKRTLDYDITAVEIPPMGDPPGTTNARGTFSIHKMNGKIVGGTTKWRCTLRATYVVRKDQPARLAWLAFIYLVWWRMQYSRLKFMPFVTFGIPRLSASPDPYNTISPFRDIPPSPLFAPAQFYADPIGFYNALLAQYKKPDQEKPEMPQAWLIDFNLEEGLYRDSKQITFEVSWLLTTTFVSLLGSSGLWRWDPKSLGGNVWALSVQDITGWKSWLANRVDASADMIVDMGHPV
jgi:hypothetical protein